MTQLGIRRLIEEGPQAGRLVRRGYRFEGRGDDRQNLGRNVEAIRMASPDGAGARGPAYYASLARMIDAENL
jgi:hypothetical protein